MSWTEVMFLLILFSKVEIYPANPLPQNDDYYEYEVPPGICILSKELGYQGNGVAINDCESESLKMFKEPPPGVWTLKGSYPMVKATSISKIRKKIRIFFWIFYSIFSGFFSGYYFGYFFPFLLHKKIKIFLEIFVQIKKKS